MNTSTITVTDVETKEGVSQSTQRPWKLFKVVDQGGNRYATFDGGIGQQAFAAKGQIAEIGYEVTDKGNNLLSIRVTGATRAPAAPAAKTPDGGADWDLIGLRKTRCALWAAALRGGHDAIAARTLVIAAEADIFHRDPAQSVEDGIPF